MTRRAHGTHASHGTTRTPQAERAQAHRERRGECIAPASSRSGCVAQPAAGCLPFTRVRNASCQRQKAVPHSLFALALSVRTLQFSCRVSRRHVSRRRDGSLRCGSLVECGRSAIESPAPAQPRRADRPAQHERRRERGRPRLRDQATKESVTATAGRCGVGRCDGWSSASASTGRAFATFRPAQNCPRLLPRTRTHTFSEAARLEGRRWSLGSCCLDSGPFVGAGWRLARRLAARRRRLHHLHIGTIEHWIERGSSRCRRPTGHERTWERCESADGLVTDGPSAHPRRIRPPDFDSRSTTALPAA